MVYFDRAGYFLNFVYFFNRTCAQVDFLDRTALLFTVLAYRYVEHPQ